MNIDPKALDGVKLVFGEDYFATPEEVENELERAYQQASQGWGVRREIGVYLALARDLKIATELAATADENQRMLKGAQMEGGRLKKKIAELEAEALAATIKETELKAEIDRLNLLLDDGADEEG